jgi:hypothetical protein
MPELQILNGALQWKTVRIASARFVIGRKDGCHLILQDGWVSREHTLIFESRPGDYVVKDLGSENGTFLNGEKVAEGRLRNGDLVRVGRTELKFLLHAAAAEPTPARLSAADFRPDRTEAHEMAQVGAEPETERDHGRTVTDGRRPPADGGVDLRERMRRLEKRVLELEQENARFAAENSVLKRALDQAGLWDRGTNRALATPVRPSPIPVGAEAEPPAALVAGFFGVGASGRAMIEEWRRRGRRRLAACEADARAVFAAAGGLAAAFQGAEIVFVCAALGELDSSTIDAAFAALSGVAPGGVGALLVFPAVPPAARARAEAAYGAVHAAADAGRLKALLFQPDGPAAAVEAFDAVLRAPRLPQGASDSAALASDLRAVLAAGGYAVARRVPFGPCTPDAAAAAAREAIDPARVVKLAPSSRARAAAAWILLENGASAADRPTAVAFESALGSAAGILPQTRLKRGVCVDGTGDAAAALTGGLPLPAKAFGDAP